MGMVAEVSEHFVFPTVLYSHCGVSAGQIAYKSQNHLLAVCKVCRAGPGQVSWPSQEPCMRCYSVAEWVLIFGREAWYILCIQKMWDHDLCLFVRVGAIASSVVAM